MIIIKENITTLRIYFWRTKKYFLLFCHIFPLDSVYISEGVPSDRRGVRRDPITKGRQTMKSIRSKIICVVLTLCLLLPVAGCGPAETVEEDTPYYAPVITRDEPESDPADPEVSSEADGLSSDSDVMETETAEDELSELDQMRDDYNFGTCKSLRGEVAVVLFYMNDFESQWTKEEMDRFTRNEVKPALAFLEQEAEKYGVELTLTVKKTYASRSYDGEVIQSTKESGYCTTDVLWQAMDRNYFSSVEDMIKSFRNRYITDEIICLTVFNKDGGSYAINPKRGSDILMEEHCVLFARDLHTDTNAADGSQAAVIASNILYLYGAESFTASETRKSMAIYHYPYDLMLSAAYDIHMNVVGRATAFYIGWTDEAPDVMYQEGW